MPSLLAALGLRYEELNVAKIILASLAFANTVLGAYLGAFGAYLIATSDAEFTNFSRLFSIVMLGLVSVYVSSIAAAGVLLGNRAHVQNAAVIVLLVVLSELILTVYMTWDLMEAKQDLHKSWMRIFNINPLSLQRVEHYYGCCGFSDRDDMPSHPDCLKGLDDSIVNGCASYLAQSTFDRNRMAIIRCAIAMVLQILFIVIGWGLVAGVLEPNTRWIAEDRNQEENWAAGTSQAPPTTADVTVDESGPQNTPEAHMLDVADDELLGLSSDVQPKSVLATSKAVVVHHGDDATHLPEN